MPCCFSPDAFKGWYVYCLKTNVPVLLPQDFISTISHQMEFQPGKFSIIITLYCSGPPCNPSPFYLNHNHLHITGSTQIFCGKYMRPRTGLVYLPIPLRFGEIPGSAASTHHLSI
jgi:hypothetical protein